MVTYLKSSSPSLAPFGTYCLLSDHSTELVSYYQTSPGIQRCSWRYSQLTGFVACTLEEFQAAKSATLSLLELADQFELQCEEYDKRTEELKYLEELPF